MILWLNFGTSERFFNQQAFFENVHNLTKDGLMFPYTSL